MPSKLTLQSTRHGPPASNVSMLLHGTDALSPPATLAIADSSTYAGALNLTNASGVQIVTNPVLPVAPGDPLPLNADPRSILFPGDASTGRVVTPSDARFSAGTEDYTVEVWVYRTGDGVLWDSRSGPSTSGNIVEIGGGTVYCVEQEAGYPSPYSTVFVLSSATPCPSGAWTHIALCREGDTTRMFIGGVNVAESSVHRTNLTNNYFKLGSAVDNVRGFHGYMNEFRITKGIALYTANFTPPTPPLPNP